jgi:hypothetical protein
MEGRILKNARSGTVAKIKNLQNTLRFYTGKALNF